MKNNKLSIYREVLRFPCDILNLQEKIDLLITISRLCGYDVSCKFTLYNHASYLRVKFSKNDLLKIMIDFYYDMENNYIRKINLNYDRDNIELKKIFGNEIKEIVEEIDKLIEIM